LNGLLQLFAKSMRQHSWKTMKFLKYALVLGAATVAVSANAQFGATSKADLSTEGGKQGIYGTYSPVARNSDANGYVLSFEKILNEGKDGPNVFGGFYSRFDGAGLYQFHYRTYRNEDSGYQLGMLGGDGFGNKNDFQLMYFKELPGQGAKSLSISAMGGLYYETGASKFHPTVAVKASYPLQNGFSLDATAWYLRNNDSNNTLFSVGVGYRF
jgi:hypothetical protein